MSSLKEMYDWFYCPGETLKGIGFYINPYKQWADNQLRHIFAFDACCNLYVGQYSVYEHHIDKICDLDDKREYGDRQISWPIIRGSLHPEHKLS